MAYTYTTVDGQRVEVTVAARFREMAAEFQRVWGMTLHVRSGTRTWDEQLRLYNGWINRLPGYNLALHPSNPLAYHVETNPTGPRALDLYDSGNDAGVSVAGSRRNNWIRDNCPRWGFTLSGLTFRPVEGWHIHFTGVLGGSTAGGETGFPANARYGSEWVKAGQTKLTKLGLYSGDIDGLDGALTQIGTKALQVAGGLESDGIYGPVTNDLADLILAGRNIVSTRTVAEIQRAVGAGIDDVWGPLTSYAVYKWQRANGQTADAIWGPASDAKAFPPLPDNPDGSYPTNGRNITPRPTKDIQLKLLELKYDLGSWGADGQYGELTSVAVAKYQETQKLDIDGIYGNATDAKLFPGIPYPEDSNSVATPRTPVYPGAIAGWNVPLGQSERDPGSIISKYIIHHETAFSTQVPYFKIENDRGSCPTWEVDRTTATEMIHPAKRPSATGLANTYSVASETVNVSGAPDWKVAEESIVTHAQIAAWLSQQTQFTDPDTGEVFQVRILLNRACIIGHNEAGVNATACPGPHLASQLDFIVTLAKQIVEDSKPDPVPEPGTDYTVPKELAEELRALVLKAFPV